MDDGKPAVCAGLLYHAKLFAYMNKMPWGYVNHDNKGLLWIRPWHSTLGRRCGRKA